MKKLKRIRKVERPCTKFSTRKKWIVYFSSYILQSMAFIKVLFTGKEVKYAFYYSKKQKEIGQKINLGRRTYPTFNGREYSECSNLKNGWNNWNDSQLVGIGSDSDININYK